VASNEIGDACPAAMATNANGIAAARRCFMEAPKGNDFDQN
jgi:hypothetical protein